MTIWEILRELRLSVESGLLTKEEGRQLFAAQGGKIMMEAGPNPTGSVVAIGAPVPTNGTQTLPSGEISPLDASAIEGARASKPATPAEIAQWAARQGIKETGQVPPARG